MNYLAQVYLAHLLKDLMSKALKPRMVFVSAESHRFSTLSEVPITKVIIAFYCVHTIADLLLNSG